MQLSVFYTIFRLWNYSKFYSVSLVGLIKLRYQCVMYFEILSSFSALLYKTFIGPSCEIFAHYHEYTSPKEYEEGVLLNNYFHKMERVCTPSLPGYLIPILFVWKSLRKILDL